MDYHEIREGMEWNEMEGEDSLSFLGISRLRQGKEYEMEKLFSSTTFFVNIFFSLAVHLCVFVCA